MSESMKMIVYCKRNISRLRPSGDVLPWYLSEYSQTIRISPPAISLQRTMRIIIYFTQSAFSDRARWIVLWFMSHCFLYLSRHINYFHWRPSIKLEIGIFVFERGDIYSIISHETNKNFIKNVWLAWEEKSRFIPSSGMQLLYLRSEPKFYELKHEIRHWEGR